MSLDDLDDTPLTVTPALTQATADYLDYLDGLIDTPDVYGFAEDTLRGIAASIRQRGHATDGQLKAVRNIVAGADEGRRTRERHRSSRRYEGWSR